MTKNYQLLLDEIITNIPDGDYPSLLLHCCCAPCSTYVLEYLSQYFKITIIFYNPNIDTLAEHDKRLLELRHLISKMNLKNKIDIISIDYEPKYWFEQIKGLEKEPEGGLRCYKCFELRLRKSAVLAKDKNFDYFTTTLSISPYKNAAVINEIGKQLEGEIGVKYLYADFKKRNGYLRSLELSKKYQLYRQDYCGCRYSKIIL